MIAQPAPIFAERQHEQVLLKDQAHEVEPILRLRVKRTQDDLAEFWVEFLEQGSAHEEFAHRFRLLIEHLMTQIGECIHTGNARHPGWIGQHHASDPAAGLIDQLICSFLR